MFGCWFSKREQCVKGGIIILPKGAFRKKGARASTIKKGVPNCKKKGVHLGYGEQ